MVVPMMMMMMVVVMPMTMIVTFAAAAGLSLRRDRLSAVRRSFRLSGREFNLAGRSLRRSRRILRLLAGRGSARSRLIGLRRCRLRGLDILVRAATRHQRKRQQRPRSDPRRFRKFRDQPYHPFSSFKFLWAVSRLPAWYRISARSLSSIIRITTSHPHYSRNWIITARFD
jgi:hypothetical protein